MPLDWNPNLPLIAGLENQSRTVITRRIGSSVEQLLQRWRALSSGDARGLMLYADAGSQAAPITAGAPQAFNLDVNSPVISAGANNPPRLSRAALLVDVVPRASEATSEAVQVNTYTCSALAAPASAVWRNAADTGNATSGDVVNPDSAYVQSVAAHGGKAVMALSFAAGGFANGRHVIGVEFEIRSKGQVHLATQRASSQEVGGWLHENNAWVVSSTDWKTHVLRIGEVLIEKEYTSTNFAYDRLVQWNAARIAAFAAGGSRRLRVASDTATPGVLVDYVLMRVYSIAERRLATGMWEPDLTVMPNGYTGTPGAPGFRPLVMAEHTLTSEPGLWTPTLLQRITNKQRTANVVTLTFATPHGFTQGQTVRVSHLPSADGINGLRTLSSVTSTTIVFTASGSDIASTAVTTGGFVHGLWARTTGTDYSLIVRRPAPGGLVNIPEATGVIRLLGPPGVHPARYSSHAVGAVAASGQPSTVGPRLDGVLPLRWAQYIGDTYLPESQPYRRPVPQQLTGTSHFYIPPATATYNVAYVVIAIDFAPARLGAATDVLTWEFRGAEGEFPPITVTTTRAEIEASPLVGTEKVTLGGVTKLVHWRRVRLDLGAGRSATAGTNAVLTSTSINWGTNSFTIVAAVGTANSSPDAAVTWPGSGIGPTTGDAGSYADAETLAVSSEAQIIVAQRPPAPTGLTLTAKAFAYAGDAGPAAVVGWTPPASNAAAMQPFKHYEVQRKDARTTWQTVALLTDVAATGFADHEARVGVPTTYRVRTIRTDGIEGNWVHPEQDYLTADQQSFETGTGGWEPNNCVWWTERSTEQAAVGAASLKFLASCTNGSSLSGPTVSIVGGFTYTLRMKARAAATSRLYSISMSFQKGPPWVPLGQFYKNDNVSAPNVWTQSADLTALAPADANEVNLSYLGESLASNEVHYIDDVHLIGPKFVTLAAPRGQLLFSSNEDPGLGVAASDVYSSAPARSYSFPEAEEVVTRRIYGRGLPVAFRPPERRGTGFTRTLLVRSGKCPPASPVGPDQFDAIRDLAAAELTYVAVRDSDGNRWFGAIAVAEGRVTHTAGAYEAALSFVETASDPSTPAVSGPLA